MKKKWIFILGTILLLGGGFWQWRSRSGMPEYETVSVSRGTVEETVSVSAVLIASDDINLNFETAGRIKSISVREGQKVEAGETIAALESVALREEVLKAQAAVEKAKADAQNNDNALREAREGEKDAKAYYEAVKDLENQKVDAADKAYENADDYEDDAEAYYNQIVADEGVGSVEAKTARLTFTTAVNNRKAADEAKETARKSRESAIRYAQNSWNSAKERTDSLESSAERTIETSAIEVAEANYRIALDNAENANIKAPVNGMVTKVNYRAGEVIGTSVSGAFGKLLSYDLLLEAKVPESDIVSVRLGQKADISFDAFDVSTTLPAEVVEIEPDSTVIQDVVYYVVKLRLSGLDAKLKPGMSGDADIHIAEKRGALTLPGRLLVEESEKWTARVLLSTGAVETREVSVGLRGDDGIVEILSGLSEGDRVISETKK